MSSNPYNLVLRLLIEVYGYIVFGFTGFFITESLLRWPLAIALPVLAGAIWGVFYFPGDPAGIGKALLRISGIQRLLLELVFFALVVSLSFLYVNNVISFIYLYLVIVHNALSYDRIGLLIRKSRTSNVADTAA